jgi:hypothetical protein
MAKAGLFLPVKEKVQETLKVIVTEKHLIPSFGVFM